MQPSGPRQDDSIVDRSSGMIITWGSYGVRLRCKKAPRFRSLVLVSKAQALSCVVDIRTMVLVLQDALFVGMVGSVVGAEGLFVNVASIIASSEGEIGMKVYLVVDSRQRSR